MASIRLTVGATILVTGAAMAIGGTLLSPDAYLGVNLPMRFAVPDFANWLGRDELGRDTLSRLLAGATYTLGQTLAAAAFALATGLLVRLLTRRFERVVIVLARALFVAPKFLLGRSPVGHVMLAALGAASCCRTFLVLLLGLPGSSPGMTDSSWGSEDLFRRRPGVEGGSHAAAGLWWRALLGAAVAGRAWPCQPRPSSGVMAGGLPVHSRSPSCWPARASCWLPPRRSWRRTRFNPILRQINPTVRPA